MNKLTEALLEGSINFEKEGCNGGDLTDGTLDFSCLNIELLMQKGEVAEGFFSILSPSERVAEGNIYSSDMRMECLDKEFIGVNEQIRYRFHSDGLEEGSVIEGQFFIISNYGEYEIPYRIVMEGEVVNSSLGNIKNMFLFTNLAKSNWAEAVRIFYSKQFRHIFSGGNDKQYYNIYKGLSAVPGNEQNVEEFLLEINKKQRVEYIPNQTEILIEDPRDAAEYGLAITKNGWGHTFLKFKVEGDFILIEKEQISDDEFLGNAFKFPFYIDCERLHSGRNYGRIHIFNSYIDISILVTVIKNTDRRMLGVGREKKRNLVQIMEYYEAFRSKKISTRTWISETEKLVERLSSLDEKDLPTRLFKVQLLVTQERFNEAKWLLDHIKPEIKRAGIQPEIKCYYLYLTTLYSREAAYVDEIAAQVEQIYHANRDNWRIAWLILYLSEEYGRNPERRWRVLEEQFNLGCRSPILYVEAWHLWERNPTMLSKLGDFEIQTMNYAAKKELLTQDIVMQFRYLVQKMKDYSERIYEILQICYEKFPNDETLLAICALLIKGNKTAEIYFKWYSLSVEREIRITKLYEYYMMSLPTDYQETLPKMILMYFAYHSELDYRKKAFLYAYVYRNRETQPELYINYCEQLERFVLEQIRRGRINKDLAYLYKNIITPRIMNEEIAQDLSTLLFMNLIRTENEDIRQVIICYTVGKKEYSYPMSDKKAWVPLYGSDYNIFLEDAEGNRYSGSVSYQVEKMMLSAKMVEMIDPYVTEHFGLDLYVCEGNKAFLTITKESVKRFRHIADSEELEDSVKSEMRMRLVHFYYEQDYMRELDSYLIKSEPGNMSSRERNEMIRFMITRGIYDQALEWIKGCGTESIDAKNLVRLCSRLLARDGMIEDEKMTHIIYYAFSKGKYDANLLTYLVHFYNSSLKQMREIWRAAVAFETDTYELSERMIAQMLFSGSFVGERMEIFKSYVSGGAKTFVESAFLTQCAYDFFIKEDLIDSFVFIDIAKTYERGDSVNKICKLAFLKYYAENKEEITEQIRAIIKTFVYDILDENIYFPFFKEYMVFVPILEQYLDKTMIEYKSKSGSKAVIHYIIERGQHTDIEYRKEEMRDMYGGICVKGFVLFFGEKLQYYITEEYEGKEQLTESGSISKSDILQDVLENRFSMINDIVIGKTLQDYDTVDCLLDEYYRKDYIVSKAFQIK